MNISKRTLHSFSALLIGVAFAIGCAESSDSSTSLSAVTLEQHADLESAIALDNLRRCHHIIHVIYGRVALIRLHIAAPIWAAHVCQQYVGRSYHTHQIRKPGSHAHRLETIIRFTYSSQAQLFHFYPT
jgi:hypothetical protein